MPSERTRRSRPPRLTRALRQLGLVGALAMAGALVVACEPVPDEPPTTTAPIPAPNGDIGWEGPSFSGASGSPSGSKPESKLWWNAGSWWADLWDVTTGDFYVHRLNLATRTWVRTATRLDDRSNSRSDVLWDGTKLYVASHAFAEGASTTPTAPSYLRRFSYQAATGTYTLDPGFPVQINDARSETLVIDRDSLGRIWATWTEDRQVRVAVSNVGGSTWGASIALPVAGSRVTSDDISSIVAFGGNRIGVLWSNQDEDTMYFSSHADSAALGTWSAAEVAYRGTSAADDHLNLKNVTDQNGRILAAVKTSQSGSSPLVHLLDRSPSGAWSSKIFGTGSDNHTRPIVVVDRQHSMAHVFATSGQSGGKIYRKTAPLSNLTFPTGKGSAVLSDADSADINNATSTKQAVDGSSGLVVLATNDTTRRYWTHYDPLGGATTPSAPQASFVAAPTRGTAPLAVNFTDTSTGSPTSWAWEFGDGTTSTVRNPTHTYLAPGTYTVTLRATNASGTDTSVRTDLVEVGSTAPTGQPMTFPVQADALVKSSQPTKNYGTTAELRTRVGDPEYRSYLRFAPTGLTGPPTKAVLRLWATDASRVASTVASTATGWGETTVTWNTAPAAGAARGAVGAFTAGRWVEIDVTAAVTGSSPVAFVLSSTSTDSAIFASRETTNAPQLVVTPADAV
jgi:PKD repeat protein